MADRRRHTGTLRGGAHDRLARGRSIGCSSTARCAQGQTARSLVANQITRACDGARPTGSIYAFPMGYPGFVEGDGRAACVGEVLWLTELAATFGLLDAYEGADFARVIRQVTLDIGRGDLGVDLRAVRSGSGKATARGSTHGDWVRYWTEQAEPVPRPELLSDEEVTEDRHRKGGESRGDRSGPDLAAGQRQTLLHEARFLFCRAKASSCGGIEHP